MKNCTLLLFGMLIACEPPGVYPGADRLQNTQLSRIEGHVVVNSKVRGNVIVFLFDAARPPPPLGSGRPVTFTVLSQDTVFGQALVDDSGPFTAPFAFSLVPPGHYTIQGFVDGNLDFVPWYDVTDEVDTGDVGGAAIEPSTFATRDVVVTIAEPALDVPVSFADTALVALDRPSFTVPGFPSFTFDPKAGATEIELDLLMMDQGLIHQSRAAFLAKFIDDNMDGVPDDANMDGVPDLWPKVLVRKLDATGANPLLDENDLDHNGILDPPTDAGFADYEHVNPMTGMTIPPDGQPDEVVLAAGIDPTDLAPLLVDPMTGMVKQTPTPVTKLKLVIKPLAVDISQVGRLCPLGTDAECGAPNTCDPTTKICSNPPLPLKTVPPGRYAVTVVQLTGQTWRLPNELSPPIAVNLGLPLVSTQSFVINVP